MRSRRIEGSFLQPRSYTPPFLSPVPSDVTHRYPWVVTSSGRLGSTPTRSLGRSPLCRRISSRSSRTHLVSALGVPGSPAPPPTLPYVPRSLDFSDPHPLLWSVGLEGTRRGSRLRPLFVHQRGTPGRKGIYRKVPITLILYLTLVRVRTRGTSGTPLFPPTGCRRTCRPHPCV